MALLFLGLCVPVILLYLLKQRRRRVEVSTLMFWDQILRDEQSVTSLNKLKKLLSLLLQLAFVALLAFAIARPTFSGKWTGARWMVLILDSSASMLVDEAGKTRFELAREKAAAIIRGMSIGDTMMLVNAGSSPEIVSVFSDNRKDLLEALDKIEASHGEADFHKALKLVSQLPADDRQTDVYLVTDGAFEPVDVEPAKNIKYAWVKIGQATENVGIVACQVRPMPSSPRDFEIHLEMANETGRDVQFPVELRLGGRLADAFEFEIPAGKTVAKDLKQYSAEGGDVEVFADFKDSFPLDNRAYGVLPAPRKIRVALVTENDLFLERALGTDEGVELAVVKPAEYPGTNQSDVTVFAGWQPSKVPGGNCIFILNWPEDLGLARKGMVERPMFTEWDRAHPVNRHLALQNISIERAVAVERTDKFVPIATSFNDPLVLLNETPEGKRMVVAFDPNTSDLPLRIAFPIMIANAVRYLSGADSGDRWESPPLGSILTGADIAKYETAGGTNSFDRVYAPGDEVIVTTSANALVPVQRAGVYRGGDGGTNRYSLFAANLNSKAESRIAPAEKIPLKSKEPIVELKQGMRFGMEAWFTLVFAALILSAVEWGLYHRRVIE